MLGTRHAATSRVPARVRRLSNTIAHSKQAETIHQISRMLSHNQATRSGLELTLNGEARNLAAGAEDRKSFVLRQSSAMPDTNPVIEPVVQAERRLMRNPVLVLA